MKFQFGLITALLFASFATGTYAAKYEDKHSSGSSTSGHHEKNEDSDNKKSGDGHKSEKDDSKTESHNQSNHDDEDSSDNVFETDHDFDGTKSKDDIDVVKNDVDDELDDLSKDHEKDDDYLHLCNNNHEDEHQDDDDGEHEHVNAVPIPGALWLLGSSLVGLAGIKRKKD